MPKLTVGKLIEILSELPRDSLVVTPSNDHSYRDVYAHSTTILIDGRDYTEDYGEKITPESEYGVRIPAVVVE